MVVPRYPSVQSLIQCTNSLFVVVRSTLHLFFMTKAFNYLRTKWAIGAPLDCSTPAVTNASSSIEHEVVSALAETGAGGVVALGKGTIATVPILAALPGVNVVEVESPQALWLTLGVPVHSAMPTILIGGTNEVVRDNTQWKGSCSFYQC